VTNEQVRTLLDFFSASLAYEVPVTKKVLAAVPAGPANQYRPDPKSRSGLELAYHIAFTEKWFCDSFLAGSFDMVEEKVPGSIQGGEDLAAWYEANVPPLLEKVKQLPPEKLAQSVDFFGVFNQPVVTYLGFFVNHTVHHRGQLSSYLRAMGSKVPSIYGGSADEPMQM